MELPRRKSIRLNGYDYSKNGYYFITICTYNREHLFKEIVGANLCVRPNDANLLIEKWLFELENKYNYIKIDKYVIMPNHIHFILIINNKTGEHDVSKMGEHDVLKTDKHDVGDNKMGEHDVLKTDKYDVGDNKTGEHTGSPLHEMIKWFKTQTTNDYIKCVKNNLFPPFNKHIWQRSYYEHIIRNENEYRNIWKYIDENPLKWVNDCFYL